VLAGAAVAAAAAAAGAGGVQTEQQQDLSQHDLVLRLAAGCQQAQC
jgi:hypothetical protein